MKTTVLKVLFFNALFWIPFNAFSQKEKQLYCHARSGLSLRSTPSLSAEKDTLIKYGESVSLIQKTDSIFSVNGLKGSWLKVKYANKIGYVFSSYLNKFPFTVKKGKGIYLKDYAFENLKQTSGTKNFEMTDEQANWHEAIFGDNRYQCSPGGYCDLDEKLYLTGISVQDAMVMFCAYLDAYKDYKFNRSKFSYSKETKTYQYSYYKKAKPEGFGQDYYMSYKIDKKGDYIYMMVGFDWDGGGGSVIINKFTENLVCIEHTYSCH